jgi:hypothetical protein
MRNRMTISIKRLATEKPHTDGDAADIMHIYRVIDNGREFTITYAPQRPGGNLGLAGQRGFLYTDRDTDTVRRQIINVGLTCGVIIEDDEVVEGLSPWAIRGVIIAERSGETREIAIAGPSGADPDGPVILVEGKTTDLRKHLPPSADRDI